MKTITSAILSGLLITLPLQADLTPAPKPPDNDTWLALCVLAVVGVAVTSIYIVSKKCEPKYYWLMDDDQNFWVASCTKKEAQINGWHRIGGPYKTPQDAPTTHPNPTNRVESAIGPINTVKVQYSTNLVDWCTVHQEVADLEDFVYWPTNSGMYRLEVGP